MHFFIMCLDFMKLNPMSFQFLITIKKKVGFNSIHIYLYTAFLQLHRCKAA